MDVSGTEYGEVKSDAIDLDPSLQIEKVGWTKDGQVLTVGTTNGQILSYLAALPVVSDFYGTQVNVPTDLLYFSGLCSVSSMQYAPSYRSNRFIMLLTSLLTFLNVFPVGSIPHVTAGNVHC